MARSLNPIGFTPLPVTFFTLAIYIAVFALLLFTQHTVPSAPSSPTPKSWPGVNITKAWQDLQELSKDFHPYNSRANLNTRAWLLERVEEILDTNCAGDWKVETETAQALSASLRNGAQTRDGPKSVTIFDDRLSNITFADGINMNYFEGDNLMVYIRGTEDDQSDWWTNGSAYEGSGGVMVNAHFDSVSTGYGATDDGVGTISVLQLISYFTKEGQQPKRGLLALLNNGEEDGLYGAHAFTKHPMSRFPHSFLNLEGAGAGGRATLFRSTDTEVTRFYGGSKYPFGSIVSNDGFKRGLIRSGTDYSVFTESLGMRGLDVAFMEPRARYHTSQDDARDTSVDSLWHMLSAALATVKGLTDDTSQVFVGSDRDTSKVHAGKGTSGVWFDIFGRAFAVIELHAMFAISVALLVAGPIVLILLEVIVRKSDKWYPFSGKSYVHGSDDDEPVHLYGFRGFFRFPPIFVISTAAIVALAYLVTKLNPFIVYSSPYAVYGMMMAAWLSVTWFLLRLGDVVRPSALSRLFTHIWLYTLSWILLVAVTIGENNLGLGSGYFMVIYNASFFVALLISYFELFGLPRKSVFTDHAYYGPVGHDDTDGHDDVTHESEHPDPSAVNAEDAEEADERTSLLNSRQTFTRYGAHRRREGDDTAEHENDASTDPLLSKAYEGEQAWSSSLPTWTWLLQFLITGPINLIIIGQIGLLVISALQMTPADGTPVFTIYLLMASVSVLLLLPLTPFVHRLKYQVPTILFLVFIGTLIYSLVAFPFSRDARLKVYFVQRVDLQTGNNQVALAGLDGYLQDIVAQMPSAAGQDVQCGTDVAPWGRRNGLNTCVWTGVLPNVVPDDYFRKPHSGIPYPNATINIHGNEMSQWVELNVSRSNSSSEVHIGLQGLNSRACRLLFDRPVANISIAGAGSDGTNLVPEEKNLNTTKSWRLWSRDLDGKYDVTISDVHDEQDSGRLSGTAVCQWADINQVGVVPAFDEIKRYIPVWAIVSKANDGLVEGTKKFEV